MEIILFGIWHSQSYFPLFIPSPTQRKFFGLFSSPFIIARTWNLPPNTKMRRMNHPACKRDQMECYLMDDSHWKTPPLWICKLQPMVFIVQVIQWRIAQIFKVTQGLSGSKFANENSAKEIQRDITLNSYIMLSLSFSIDFIIFLFILLYVLYKIYFYLRFYCKNISQHY